MGFYKVEATDKKLKTYLPESVRVTVSHAINDLSADLPETLTYRFRRVKRRLVIDLPDAEELEEFGDVTQGKD